MINYEIIRIDSYVKNCGYENIWDNIKKSQLSNYYDLSKINFERTTVLALEKSIFEKIDDVISTGRDICTIVGAATIMYYGIKGIIFIKESFTNHIKGKDNDKNKRYSGNISDAEFEVIDGEE